MGDGQLTEGLTEGRSTCSAAWGAAGCLLPPSTWCSPLSARCFSKVMPSKVLPSRTHARTHARVERRLGKGERVENGEHAAGCFMCSVCPPTGKPYLWKSNSKTEFICVFVAPMPPPLAPLTPQRPRHACRAPRVLPPPRDGTPGACAQSCRGRAETS